MRHRRLSITALALAACLILGAAGQANAVNIGLNIEVFKNGSSQGTAFGGSNTAGNTPLIVTAVAGDTLRFVMMYNIADTGTYSVTHTADANNAAGGSAEMAYVGGSGVELSGTGFAGGNGNPNTSLNDGTPTAGSAANISAAPSGTLLYRVDYIVQAGVNSDGNRDFTGVLIAHASSPVGNLVDSQTDTASVRVNAGAVVPEPASLLLLGSGLAGLFGFGRKKFRK